MREIPEPPDFSELRKLQSKYQKGQLYETLILITLNTSIVKDFKVKQILTPSFISEFCALINFIPPTTKKLSALIARKSRLITQSIAHDFAEIANGNISVALNLTLLFLLNQKPQRVACSDQQATLFNLIGRVLYNKRKTHSGEMYEYPYAASNSPSTSTF